MSQVDTTKSFVGLDRELCSMLSEKLAERVKANKAKITVIPSIKLEAFKSVNRDWVSMRSATIGKWLGADVVLDVSLENINIDKPNSDSEHYQWRGNVNVSIYDTDEHDGHARIQYIHKFDYPKSTVNRVESNEIGQFRQQFLERLSRELVCKHLWHFETEEAASDD